MSGIAEGPKAPAVKCVQYCMRECVPCLSKSCSQPVLPLRRCFCVLPLPKHSMRVTNTGAPEIATRYSRHSPLWAFHSSAYSGLTVQRFAHTTCIPHLPPTPTPQKMGHPFDLSSFRARRVVSVCTLDYVLSETKKTSCSHPTLNVFCKPTTAAFTQISFPWTRPGHSKRTLPGFSGSGRCPRN